MGIDTYIIHTFVETEGRPFVDILKRMGEFKTYGSYTCILQHL